MHIPSLFDVRGKVGTCVPPSSVIRLAERPSWIAVVTGGGSGIGTMIAAAYVQNGAKVYIAARKEKQLKDVCLPLSLTYREERAECDTTRRVGLRRVECEGAWKLPLLRG